MKVPTSLKDATNTLEDSIITLSGPALAISGIIAGVDLLTGGTWMQAWPWLTFAWAVTLLLSLDFQVLSLGARVHKVYLSNKGGWRKVGEIVIAVLIAAAISFVSIQMQSIIARSNSVAGLSIADATAQLGINPIWLIWQRSALVLVLIFMSGWFREEQVRQDGAANETPETPASINDETMQLILGKLARLDHIEQALSRPYNVIQEPGETQLALPAQVGETLETELETSLKLGMIEQSMYDAIMSNPSDAGELLALSKTMALDEFTSVLKGRYSQYESYITPQRVSKVLAYAHSQKVLETDETEVETPTLQAQLEKLLSISPNITTRDAAAIIGRAPSTVGRHMLKMRQSV